MAATHTVTLYAVIIALFCFALASVAIWSRRELRIRLVAVGLAVAMVPVIWFVFSQLPGKPDDITAEEFREKYQCATIIPIKVDYQAPIYLLAKTKYAREPKYLVIAWNMRLAKSLQESMRVAKVNDRGSIIYGRASCINDKKRKDGRLPEGSGDDQRRLPGGSGVEQEGEDGFIFAPDPVPPLPEKNYGPLYEGPIEMPQR
jgi:hypothetical protein